jgi:hypothetical protein
MSFLQSLDVALVLSLLLLRVVLALLLFLVLLLDVVLILLLFLLLLLPEVGAMPGIF